MNFAHLSSNIELQSANNKPPSKVKQSAASTTCKADEIDLSVIKKTQQLLQGLQRLTSVLKEHSPEVQQAKEIADKVLKQQEQQGKDRVEAEEIEPQDQRSKDLELELPTLKSPFKFNRLQLLELDDSSSSDLSIQALDLAYPAKGFYPSIKLPHQQQASSSSSGAISSMLRIPIALAALPFTLTSSTAYASENSEELANKKDSSSSSTNPRASWISKAHRAFKGERSSEILEWQNVNRSIVPRIATGFDAVREGEEFCNTQLQNSKEILNQWLGYKLQDTKDRLRLESLNLSLSDQFILNTKKLALQAASSAIQQVVPGSTSELREKVLEFTMGSGLYYMYRLGEEFNIPGKPFGIERIAPFGNRTSKYPETRKTLTRKEIFDRELPHYHRRVPNPKNPQASIPGQSAERHRPWESSKIDGKKKNLDGSEKKLDKKFTDRF